MGSLGNGFEGKLLDCIDAAFGSFDEEGALRCAGAGSRFGVMKLNSCIILSAEGGQMFLNRNLPSL